jgi:DNA-directed RNA polymerase subunit E'/Rpb7
MKIIITEEQHKQILYDYIAEYVNDTLEESNPARFESFIVIYDVNNVGDIEDDILIEYDNFDGRLWFSKNYMYRLQSLIPLDKEIIHDIVKDCFEKRFDVEVSFVES